MIKLSTREKKQVIVMAVIIVIAIAVLCILTYAPFGTNAFKEKYGFDLLNDKVFYSAEYLDAHLSGLPIEAVSDIKIQSILVAVCSIAILITIVVYYVLLVNRLGLKWCLAIPIPIVAILLNVTQFAIKMIILNKLPGKSGFLYSFEAGLNTCGEVAIILAFVLLFVMAVLVVIKQLKPSKSTNNKDESLSNSDVSENISKQRS